MTDFSSPHLIASCLEPLVDAERARATKEALNVLLKHSRKALRSLLADGPEGFEALSFRVVESELRVSTRSDDRLPEVEIKKPDGSTFRLNRYSEDSEENTLLHWVTGRTDLDPDDEYQALVESSQVQEELSLATFFLAIAAIESAHTDHILFSAYERELFGDESKVRIAASMALPGTSDRAVHLDVLVDSDSGNIESVECELFGTASPACQIRLKQADDPFVGGRKPGSNFCLRHFDMEDVLDRVGGELSDELINLAEQHVSQYEFGDEFNFATAGSHADPFKSIKAQHLLFGTLEPAEFGVFLRSHAGPIVATDPMFRRLMPTIPNLAPGTSVYEYPIAFRDYLAPLWGQRIQVRFSPEDTDLYVKSLFALGVSEDRVSDVIEALEKPVRGDEAATAARQRVAKSLRETPRSYTHCDLTRDSKLDQPLWFSEVLASSVAFPSSASVRAACMRDQMTSNALAAGDYDSAKTTLCESIADLLDEQEPHDLDPELLTKLKGPDFARGCLNGVDLTDDERYSLAVSLLSEASFTAFASHQDDYSLTRDLMTLSLPNGGELQVSVDYEILEEHDEHGLCRETVGIERIDIDHVPGGEVLVLEDELADLNECAISELKDAFCDLLTVRENFSPPDPETLEAFIDQHLATVATSSAENALQSWVSSWHGDSLPLVEKLLELNSLVQALAERSPNSCETMLQKLRDQPDLWIPVNAFNVKRAYAHLLSDRALEDTNAFSHPYQAWGRRLNDFYNLPLEEMVTDLCYLASRDIPLPAEFKTSVQSQLDSAILSNENKAQLRSALLRVKQQTLRTAPLQSPAVSRGL